LFLGKKSGKGRKKRCFLFGVDVFGRFHPRATQQDGPRRHAQLSERTTKSMLQASNTCAKRVCTTSREDIPVVELLARNVPVHACALVAMS